MGSNGEKVLSVAICAGIALGLASVALAISRYPLGMDNINMAFLIDDMLTNRNWFLSGWYIAKNNYFFTDGPVYLLTWGLFGMSPLTFRLGGALIYLLTGAALVAVMAKYGGRRAAAMGAFLYAGLPPETAKYLYIPFFHAGTVLFTVVGFHLVIRIRERIGEVGRAPALACSTLALVVALGVFSDYLMFVTLVGPAVLAIAAERLVYRRAPCPIAYDLLIAIALGAAAAMGVVLTKVAGAMGLNLAFASQFTFTDYRDVAALALKPLRGLAALYGMDVADAATPAAGRIVAAVRLVLFLAALYGGLSMLRKAGSPRARMLGLCAFFLAALLVGAYAGKTVAYHYYLAPTAVFYLVGLGHLATHASVRVRAALIALVLVSIVAAGVEAARRPAPEQPLAGLARYLREQGLAHGYSRIDRANLLTFLSRGEVKVRPVRFDLNYYIQPKVFWVNEKWFEVGNASGTFLLVGAGDRIDGFEHLSEPLIYQMFGPPARTLRYGSDTRIYVWNYDIIRKYYENQILLGQPLRRNQ
jgi:hypothetical protein